MDSDAASPSVRSANKDDIPVIAVDRGVNDAKTAALVASDNVEGGELGAKALAEKLGGKGTIVILQGQAGTSASRERGAGLRGRSEGSTRVSRSSPSSPRTSTAPRAWT